MRSLKQYDEYPDMSYQNTICSNAMSGGYQHQSLSQRISALAKPRITTLYFVYKVYFQIDRILPFEDHSNPFMDQ